MNRKWTRRAVTVSIVAGLTAAWAAGADIFHRSLSSPNVNATQPLLTVLQYEGGDIKRERLLEANSPAAKRLQSIIDGPGWRPTVVTYVPTVHFRSESGPHFTIDVSPSQAVINYTSLGILRQRIRRITQADFDALIKEIDADAQPMRRAKKPK